MTLRRAGYELSQIESSYDALKEDGFPLAGWEASPFLIFVRTIPGRFYPIAMLCLQLLLILTQRDFGTMLHAERRALNEHKIYSDTADKEQVQPPLSLRPLHPPPPAAPSRVTPRARPTQPLPTVPALDRLVPPAALHALPTCMRRALAVSTSDNARAGVTRA